MRTRKTLWMRYVDFEKIKDLLHLVFKNDGALKAASLESLAIERGVLSKKDGTPLAHSPRYHYRKVMENLGLIALKDHVYYVSENQRTLALLRRTKFGKRMSFEAEETLREIIVENRDCRRHFFDIFIDGGEYDLRRLREKGESANVTTRGKKGILMVNSSARTKIALDSYDLISAVFWGLRIWALNLQITDEIFTSYREGRTIYPIRTFNPNGLVARYLIDKAKAVEGNQDWVSLHIPTFIEEVSLVSRLPVQRIKDAMWEFVRRYRSHILLVPSSVSFIDMRTPYSKQDLILFKAYLIDERRGRYISHLKIKRSILKEGVQ